MQDPYVDQFSILVSFYINHVKAGHLQQGVEDAVAWLTAGVDNLNLDGKAWAGASHWRFRTRQNPNADPDVVDAPPKAAPKTASRCLFAS